MAEVDSPPAPAAAAPRLEDLDPADLAYLERIRRAARRLAVHRGPSDDVRVALGGLQEVSRIDLDVPTASRSRGARVTKVAVKRLTAWYLRYLGQQVAVLGAQAVRVGDALASRVERVEGRVDAMEAGLEELAVRLEHLERAGRQAATAPGRQTAAAPGRPAGVSSERREA